MGGSKKYKSPSTIRRNLYRLVKYLSRLLKFNSAALPPKLSIAKSYLDIPPTKPKLSKSPVMFTNDPNPCGACDLHQCQFDFLHKCTFAFSNVVDKVMDEAFYKKPVPPDVP